GYHVLLNDVADERVAAGMKTIDHNMARQVARGMVSMEQMQAAMPRIVATPSLEAVGQADLVIEAATENEEVKKSIFRSIAPHLGSQT
ncbi:3-hydroxyacyl-CoA dehydrogenase NAD-binding domain-containing protein, partial [Acinetobacter baumannii]